MRCTCQQAVIEALEEVVRWTEKRIAAIRAEVPEREYKHQSSGWCPVCGHAGPESEHKCRE